MFYLGKNIDSETCPSIGTGSALSGGASCEHVYSSHITLISSIFSLYIQRIEWRSVVRACVIFSHLSHLLSLLSVYLPFSLLSVLFSLLSLGASLARFERELSETLLFPLFSPLFSLLSFLFSLLSSLLLICSICFLLFRFFLSSF